MESSSHQTVQSEKTSQTCFLRDTDLALEPRYYQCPACVKILKREKKLRDSAVTNDEDGHAVDQIDHGTSRSRYVAARNLEVERKMVKVIREELKKDPPNLVANFEQSLARWRNSSEYRDHSKIESGSLIERAKQEEEHLGGLLRKIVDHYRKSNSSSEKRRGSDAPNALPSPYDLKRDVKVQIIRMQQSASERQISNFHGKEGLMIGDDIEIDDQIYKVFVRDQDSADQIECGRSDDDGDASCYASESCDDTKSDSDENNLATGDAASGATRSNTTRRAVGTAGSETLTKHATLKQGATSGNPPADQDVTDYTLPKGLCWVHIPYNNMHMPYLHWETDRNRSRMVEVIDTKRDIHEANARERKRERKEKRQTTLRERLNRERQDLPEKPCLPQIIHNRGAHYRLPQQVWDPHSVVPRGIEDKDVMWQKHKHSREEKWGNNPAKGAEPDPVRPTTTNSTQIEASRRTDKDSAFGESENGYLESSTILFPRIDSYRRLRPVHPLAQLLIDTARLYEEMMAFRDRQVYAKYLFHEDHLHPRRSLDQAYFWRLRSTRRRDRDQVLYRYTSPEFLHSFQVPPNKKEVKKRVKPLMDRETISNHPDCESCENYARNMTG
ncbi:MAG: hypothetical protein M1822_004438 [Bathelium mastoideum]|nr:MAG: hypothetical protein M1822_004438 [Bathelium mastoideum]